MINGELIIDNFAGGGGASTGIELATGYSVDIAINHDPEAIRMHKTNHPSTKHYCENVWAVDPVTVCNGNPVALAWFSPDCKHFSKAKGGKPKDKTIRGLACVACRWAGLVRPRVIILENVEEFTTWGPLNRRHPPIREKKGNTFQKFIRQLTELGYAVEYRELVAADYGAPTMRKRFFLIARSDGRPIIWPQPTHAPVGSESVQAGIRQAYVGAHTQIDFSKPCPSIFTTSEEIRQQYGLRAVRPLADKTKERIARGIKKYILDNPESFIIQCNHGGERKTGDIHEPMPTITGKHGFGIVQPVLMPYMGVNTTKHPGSSCEQPLSTITTGGQQCLVAPVMIQYHSEQSSRETRGQSVEQPLLTADSSNRYGLVMAFLSKFFGGGYSGAGDSLKNPLPTVTSWDHNSMVTVNLLQMNHHCDGRSVTDPLPTVTAGGGHFAITRMMLAKTAGAPEGIDRQDGKAPLGVVTVRGTKYLIVDIGLRMLEPRELYNCQGFPDDYIIDRDYSGRSYPRTEQVRRCGNAVCRQYRQHW